MSEFLAGLLVAVILIGVTFAAFTLMSAIGGPIFAAVMIIVFYKLL